jgi:hypothetical protein
MASISTKVVEFMPVSAIAAVFVIAPSSTGSVAHKTIPYRAQHPAVSAVIDLLEYNGNDETHVGGEWEEERHVLPLQLQVLDEVDLHAEDGKEVERVPARPSQLNECGLVMRTRVNSQWMFTVSYGDEQDEDGQEEPCTL